MSYKMLVVEDYELTARTVSALFAKMGFSVHWIADGAAVIPYLEKNPVDVLLLDLELPGMTGDKIHAALQASPALKNIAVLCHTSHREFNTAGSLIHNISSGEKPPRILLKEDLTDIDRPGNILDQVAVVLADAGKSVTPEMADYYGKTRKQTPEQVIEWVRKDWYDAD